MLQQVVWSRFVNWKLFKFGCTTCQQMFLASQIGFIKTDKYKIDHYPPRGYVRYENIDLKTVDFQGAKRINDISSSIDCKLHDRTSDSKPVS